MSRRADVPRPANQPRPFSRSQRPSVLEGLDQLDVSGRHAESAVTAAGESLVGGEHAGLESDGERAVQRMVDGPAGGVRESACASTASTRHGTVSTAARPMSSTSWRPCSAVNWPRRNLLPHGVGGFGEEQVRGEVLVREGAGGDCAASP